MTAVASEARLDERAAEALAALEAGFSRAPSFTLGAEEELVLVGESSSLPVPLARAALARLDGDPAFAPELQACQLEARTPVCPTPRALGRALAALRATLTDAADGWRPIAAGAHPLAPAVPMVTEAPRYEAIVHEWPPAAGVHACGLHVHVAVAGARRALAVHNAARSYLPLLAALGANAPFLGGRDTGMASVRPLALRALRRSGVPPAFGSLEELAGYVAWGSRSGAIPDPGYQWWDLRLHPGHGTIEFRVLDAQTTVGDAVALAALCQALTAWLVDRYESGEELPVHPSERIAEGMAIAARDGTSALLPDVETGQPEPLVARLSALLRELEPAAACFGAESELDRLRGVAWSGGAQRQRLIASERGLDGLVDWLVAETAGAAPAATPVEATRRVRPRRPRRAGIGALAASGATA